MFITLFIYVTAISFITAFTDQDNNIPEYVPCERGWYYWGEKCYKAGGRKNHERISWDRALERCRSYGGDLVSIGSQEEQDFIVTFLQLELKAWAWIGLNDRDKEEDYKWSDGTVFNYTNWVKDQPVPGHTEPEDCGHLWFEPEHNLIGYWNDLHCHAQELYICEMKSNPRKRSPNPMYCSSEGFKGLKWENSCYHVVTEKKSWQEAEKHCKNYYNGHLVSMLDILEDAFLDYIGANIKEEVWIGIKIQEQLQQKWTSGWYVSYDGFEKEIHFKGGTCVARKKRKEWITIPCSQELPFICKVSKETPPVLKPPASGSHCPVDFEDWRDLGGEYCYYFETEKALNFYEASFDCKRKGGNLVSLHAKEESDMLLPFVKYNPSGQTFFIGLFRSFPRDSSSVLVTTDPKKKAIDKDDCSVRNFVLVLFNGNIYPRMITLKSKEGCVVNFMEKKLKCCLQRPHSMIYEWNDIVAKIIPPKLLSKRNQYSIPHLNNPKEEFAWTDGSAMDYENWQLNEPNSLEEKCVEVVAQENPREESNVIPFTWNDNSCEIERSFICSVKKISSKSTKDDDCSRKHKQKKRPKFPFLGYCIARSSYLLELVNQSPDAERLP